MKFSKLLLIGCAATLLASCATPYRQQSFWSPVGYIEKQLSPNTMSISYSIGPFRNIDTADTMAFRRAVEATRQHGYQYFEIVSKTHTEVDHEQGIGGAPVEMPYPTTVLVIKMTHQDTGTSISVK